MATLLIDGVAVDDGTLKCIRAADGSLSEIRFRIDHTGACELEKLLPPLAVAVSDGHDAPSHTYRLSRFERNSQRTEYAYVKPA
jgi:hypothetical protein